MNILFVGYWAFHEGLTQATILPHLQVLSNMDKVNKIVFTSIERNPATLPFDLNIPKVTHLPIYSKNLPFNLLNKFYDFYYFPRFFLRIIKEHQIDKIICRGAPAGALGYLLYKKTKLPYFVESFEPHAAYMLESGVWKKCDPRYIMQRYWEKKIKQTASGLMPVADNFKLKLIKEGVPSSRIIIVPCSVDQAKFSFKVVDREKLRNELRIRPESIVGIYVGKFGGIYYDDEAFQLFQSAFQFFKDFFLVILTPQEHSIIIKKLDKCNISSNYYISSKPHHEIPQWLSAADFAFSLYLPSSSKKYLSPIKNGEYWSNGLPVVIPDGIGDDSEIIKREGGGAIMDFQDVKGGFQKIEDIINKPDHRKVIPALAKKYRNPDFVLTAYKKMLGISTE